MTTLLQRVCCSLTRFQSGSLRPMSRMMASNESNQVVVDTMNVSSNDDVTEPTHKRSLDEENVNGEPKAKVQKSELSLDVTSDVITKVRYPKRKVAVLLSYCGVGYRGMQINPGTETIEKDLINAFVKSGAISKEVGHSMGKMNFQRCARTDKGVSAIGQVVSLKMHLIDDVVVKINEHLPPVIRVMDVRRTTGSFNSKHHCNYRTYMYLLPTFAFQDIEEITTEKYKIADEKLKEVTDLLALFKGTHNFHNFTSGKLHNEMSANRFIVDFSCERAFVDEGIEFAIMKVKGQSFMLHQIRKMIGLIIAVVRGFAPKSTVERAFDKDKLDIPRAPGLGLVLEAVHYDTYSKKWGGDGVHEPLTWEECKQKQEEFKKKHIFPNIIIREKYNRSMLQWLSTLPLHTYDKIDGHNPLRSLIVSQKKAEMEGKDGEKRSLISEGEIPADVDVANFKPGQTPAEYLKSLPQRSTDIVGEEITSCSVKEITQSSDKEEENKLVGNDDLEDNIKETLTSENTREQESCHLIGDTAQTINSNKEITT